MGKGTEVRPAEGQAASTFREQDEQQRGRPIRWNIVVYSVVLSEAITVLVSLLLGTFMPILFIMGFIVPVLVAPGMMYYSYRLRARLIEQLIQSEERVRASLREKEVLLQEVHHRVKNNMAVVSSFLSLQSRYTDHPEAIRILKESRNRIRSMALVHEKLHLRDKQVRIDLEGYVRDIIEGLLASCNVMGREVSYSLEIDDIPLDIKTTMNCGLIINELVTNSLKYAFDEGIEAPTLHVGLRHASPEVVLSVSDNGCGIPEGVDITGGSSLGLRIVDSLVQQIQGTLQLDTSGGTAFHIRFTPNGKGVGS